METLAAVAQDVFMPLLTSPAQQVGWPDVVAKEVNENMHKFVSNGAKRETNGAGRMVAHAALPPCGGRVGIGAWQGTFRCVLTVMPCLPQSS